MTTKRTLLISLCLGLLFSGCSGSEISLTEYVERITDVIDGAEERATHLYASPQGAVLSADGSQLTDFTPQDLQVALDAIGEIELWVLAETAEIEPPEVVADFHAFFFGDTYTVARQALAARAGVAADWDELSDSPEMAAYRAAVAGDKQACADVQAMIDRTETAEAFADMPWIPGELQEVVVAVMGCGGFPDDPEQLFRPHGN